jgi:hypothetical protein
MTNELGEERRRNVLGLIDTEYRRRALPRILWLGWLALPSLDPVRALLPDDPLSHAARPSGSMKRGRAIDHE